jgi:hypothetical protein
VDFPTEGQVAHFKKLKGNAVLNVWISHPAAFERWGWFLKFAVLGGALALACAAWERWSR